MKKITDIATVPVLPPPPYEIVLSPKALVRYGFKDSRVEIGIKPGAFTPRFWHTIEAGELKIAFAALKKASSWAELSEEARQAIGAD